MEYPHYKKVLFCKDFSDNADYAFDFAYGIAKRNAGLLYILHIIPDTPQEKLLEMLIPRDIVKKLHRAIKEDIKRNYKEHYIRKIGNDVPFKLS